MYFEINVAERRMVRPSNGKKLVPEYWHLFATTPRSAQSVDEVKHLLKTILKKFPEPNYSITVTKWKEEGEGVSISELMKHE